MKLKKIINKYPSGSCEYYKNSQGQLYGPYKSFYSNGHKDCEGSFILDRLVGVWKYYWNDGRRRWIVTWNNMRNGVKIEFNYEK